MNIYPARENPIPNVTSDIILNKVTVPASLKTKESIVQTINTKKGIVITMGAGDISQMSEKIYAKIKK